MAASKFPSKKKEKKSLTIDFPPGGTLRSILYGNQTGEALSTQLSPQTRQLTITATPTPAATASWSASLNPPASSYNNNDNNNVGSGERQTAPLSDESSGGQEPGASKIQPFAVNANVHTFSLHMFNKLQQ